MKSVESESFSIYPETCPDVDKALGDCESDILWMIRDKEADISERDIKQLFKDLEKAIKEKTNGFRQALSTTIELRREKESIYREYILKTFKYETFVALESYGLFQNTNQ